MKGKLDKKLLRESIRLMMEEEWQEVDDEIKKQPHTFSPQFYEKMKRLLQSVDTFAVHTETETDGENRKNRYSFTQQNKSDLGHISFRLHVRYIAVIVLLMVGVSAVALANDDIRKGTRWYMRRRMKNSRVILLIMKITKEAIFIILNIMLNIIRDTFLMMNKKDTNKYLI